MSRAVFWFRRDLRLKDNIGLLHALAENDSVLAIFIFDELIISELPSDDPRISFIYENLLSLDLELRKYGSGLLILKGKPMTIWKKIINEYSFEKVYANKDYEPYARDRDSKVASLLQQKKIDFHLSKDQVIFEGGEILKDNGEPYHIFTPYKNKWLKQYVPVKEDKAENFNCFLKHSFDLPSLEELGFSHSKIKVDDFDLSHVADYGAERDFPSKNAGTRLGPHLRFGTVSIRELTLKMYSSSEVLLSELIWREFFMQILFHYPKVVYQNFKSKYDGIVWRNDEDDFEKWCSGNTGYPMVDAGMRELNSTGYMHNRTRMITAGFLCKHLLIDWRWGEAYFASKLLDFELSSNNGNWQWAAGTGCDAAPYFRIFNPHTQLKKFDKDLRYVKRWLPEYGTPEYKEPVVDHKAARERALNAYRAGLE